MFPIAIVNHGMEIPKVSIVNVHKGKLYDPNETKKEATKCSEKVCPLQEKKQQFEDE